MVAEQQLYDIAIIGYGPAGITAGIYAARKKLSLVLIGDLPSGEVRNSGEIENWPGDRMTDGIALGDKLIAHLDDHKDSINIITDKALKITKEGDQFATQTAQAKTFRSKTVIYTAGRHPRLLKVPGEIELKNRGVSYCAVCDAPLFPDKDVVIIGGGNSGAEAVNMFQKIAKKIYLLHNSKALKADPVLVSSFEHDPKVEIIYNTQAKKIEGKDFVEGLVYEDTNTGEEKRLQVQAVFIHIGSIPNTDPVKHLVELDEFGAVKADRYGKTNVEGFFAAGDVTDIRDAQIVVAAGHGCSAALTAGDYLVRQSQKQESSPG